MKIQFYPSFFRLLIIFLVLTPAVSLAQPSMRANLHIVAANGTTVLMDGNLTNYDNVYSNDLDMYDAWKMNNLSENFGIVRSNSVLVIERRKNVSVCDTTFFKMWNMQYRNYRLQIITDNFNTTGMTAYVVDKFLNTKTAIRLNDTSYLNFTVNTNTESRNAQRFQLIYSKPEIPFQFISCIGSKVDNAIEVQWYVSNERNIIKYFVEHSLNGMHFTDIGEVNSQNLSSNNYQFKPKNHFVTDNYYRIRAVHSNGVMYYSPLTKITGDVLVASVFPNPVVERSFYVRMQGVTKQSVLQLVSATGIVYRIPGGNVSESGNDLIKVSLPSQIYPGVYQLKVTLAGKNNDVVTVRVQ